MRLLTHAALRNPQPSTLRSIQLVAVGWGDTPYRYFAAWFSCGSANTHGWYCDPAIDRMNGRARSVQATSPHAAAALWARIDRRLADRAASLPMITERGVAFLSAAVANYQSHPYWGLIADQLWVK